MWWISFPDRTLDIQPYLDFNHGVNRRDGRFAQQ